MTFWGEFDEIKKKKLNNFKKWKMFKKSLTKFLKNFWRNFKINEEGLEKHLITLWEESWNKEKF